MPDPKELADLVADLIREGYEYATEGEWLAASRSMTRASWLINYHAKKLRGIKPNQEGERSYGDIATP